MLFIFFPYMFFCVFFLHSMLFLINNSTYLSCHLSSFPTCSFVPSFLFSLFYAFLKNYPSYLFSLPPLHYRFSFQSTILLLTITNPLSSSSLHAQPSTYIPISTLHLPPTHSTVSYNMYSPFSFLPPPSTSYTLHPSF